METGTEVCSFHRPASFLGLPLELRLQIYDLIYEPCFQPQQQFNPFYCTPDLKYCPKRGRTAVLHQVSRQLRHECMPIYLERTTFVFDLAVLDSDSLEPTLLSWVKASGDYAAFERNMIINMRAVRKEAPMFTIFVSNTKSGQRLSFKENDFSAACNLLARGMRDIKALADQKITCRHKRCAIYVDMVNELKQTLRKVDSEVPAQRSGLSVDDVVNIAQAGNLLKHLHIPARWTRSPPESATKQEGTASRYQKIVVSMRDAVHDFGHEIQPRKFYRRSRNR